VTEDDDLALAALVLFGTEASPGGDRESEHVEQPAADEGGVDLARFAGPEHRHVTLIDRLDLLEDPRVGAHAHEVGCGERRVARAVGIQHLHHVQPFGVAERQRFQQHAVDDAENGAVGADADAERHDDDERQARRSTERAEGVAKIVKDVHGVELSY